MCYLFKKITHSIFKKKDFKNLTIIFKQKKRLAVIISYS